MSDLKNSFAENNFLTVLKKLKNKLAKAREDDYDEMDLQDYGLSDEDLQELSVMDEGADEQDAADAWLKEQEEKGGSQEEQEQPQGIQEEVQQETQPQEDNQEKAVKRKRSSFRDWEPHGQYSDEQQAKIQELMDQGYSHREAERFAGAHRGPMDFQSALSHNIWPSQMSDKHLGELKEIAAAWLENKDRMDKLDADPEKSPLKHASGRAMKTFDELTSDYNNALNEFMSSEEIKGLKGRERFNAVRDWKNKYHEENPEYLKQLTGSDIHSGFKEAGSVGGGRSGGGSSGIMGQNINDRLSRIAGIGSADTMSSEEAAQHVGGVKTDMGTQASTVSDPLATGMVHPKQREMARKLLQQHGKPEQIDRMNRLKSAKSIIRRPGNKGEGENQ